jgi:cytochrome b
MTTEKTRIWDLPLRLFHWLLVGLIGVSLYTGINGGFNEMDYHMLSGYGVLTLVIFRVLWGVVGSTTARFSNFVKPSRIIAYSRTLLDRDAEDSTGHNPLGALSIVAFLLLLSVQAATGLFANDDIFLEGPLMHLVSDETSDRLTTIHHINVKLLYGLMALHLITIGFYELFKRQRLILPMITGKKTIQIDDSAASTRQPLKEAILATVMLGIAAGLVYALINYL